MNRGEYPILCMDFCQPKKKIEPSLLHSLSHFFAGRIIIIIHAVWCGVVQMYYTQISNHYQIHYIHRESAEDFLPHLILYAFLYGLLGITSVLFRLSCLFAMEYFIVHRTVTNNCTRQLTMPGSTSNRFHMEEKWFDANCFGHIIDWLCAGLANVDHGKEDKRNSQH